LDGYPAVEAELAQIGKLAPVVHIAALVPIADLTNQAEPDFEVESLTSDAAQALVEPEAGQRVWHHPFG